MGLIALAKRQIAAFVCLLLLAVLPSGAFAAAKPACDRACLEGLVGKYLDALVAHDPSRLPADRSMRFVENNQPLKLGQGTWSSVTGLGVYRHIFSDPETGQAAAIVTVKEGDTPAIMDLWLKVQDRRIAAAESQIIRDARGAAKYDQLGAPAPEWLQTVAPADRVSRDVLIGAANKYLTGMIRNDPKGDYSFFDPDCNRLEHAQPTTNVKTPEAYGHSSDTDFSSMGCEAQYKTGFLGFVTDIRDRRFVVDEERQALFAFADLDHNGTVRVIHMSTGKDFVIPAYFDVPRTLQAGEAYRMRGDKIWRIEMTLTELPYGMRPSGAATEGPRSMQTMTKVTCDRTCLGGVLDQVLQAMVDHDPAEAPLAPDVRYTENGQLLKPGDGLWGTATAIAIEGDGLSQLGPNSSAYRLYFADPGTGQVGYLGAINENGTPGMMLLRAKILAGKVEDLEAVIVRQESVGPRGGTLTLFRAPALADFTPKGFTDPDPDYLATLDPKLRSSRKVMASAVARYFQAARYNQRASTPLAPEGMLRLNGNEITASPAYDVRGWRLPMLDEDRGLALAVAMVDSDKPPASHLAAVLFRIAGGRIIKVEAIGRVVPYGMDTGWPD
jgi:hypothetical protein